MNSAPFSPLSYPRLGKRVCDVLASGAVLLLLTPLLLFLAGLIKLTSAGPVFFVQERPGFRGKPFRILKFRTMRTFENSYDADGNELSNSDRVTGVGSVLRRTSLDELPQLLNVIRGEMSIVGPRPALMYQLERYDAEQRKRLDVMPGMTGLAQVSGRNSLTWEEKIALDLAYVRGIGLRMDFMIILRTVRVVLSGAGLSFERHDRLSAHHGDLRQHVGERKEES